MLNPTANTSMPSNREMLDKVRRCIAQVVSTGQSYEMDGMKKTEADLESLRKLEAYYAGLAAEDSSAAPGAIRTWQVVF